MNSVPVNYRSLRFIAEYAVNQACEDDVVSTYRSAVQVRINDYLTIIHQAGGHAADLVATLPYAKEEGGFDGAFIGVYILRETEEALRAVLEEDDEMREMIRGYYTTTEAEDSLMRRQAGEFDRDHHADKNRAFQESAAGFIDQVAPESAISDSAAGGSAAEQAAIIDGALMAKPKNIEVQVYADDAERVPTVAASTAAPSPAQDVPETPIQKNVPETPTLSQSEESSNLPPTADTTLSDASLPPAPAQVPLTKAILPPATVPAIVEVKDDTEAYPVDPALKLFGERPVKIDIKAPDFSKKTPNEAFRSAVSWLVDHIIMVASGSRTPGKFPRIAPLMMQDVPAEYATSPTEMETVTRNIRHHASKLRVPNEDTLGGEMRRMLDGIDPTDSGSFIDAMEKMTDALRGRDPNRPSYADSAHEDGGWREASTGEEWNTGSMSDADAWKDDDED